MCVHDDWKPLNLEMSAWIEDKFTNDRAKANMKEYIEVQPGAGERVKILDMGLSVPCYVCPMSQG